MNRVGVALCLLLSLTAIASEEADVWINEIFFLHDAEGKWREYAERQIHSYYNVVTYPEQYQAEFDSWLANDLAWINVEPAFRAKLKATYSNEELMAIVESLRQYPSGYPKDPAIRGVGTQLFNIGVEVGNPIYMRLSHEFSTLRQQYEPPPPEEPGVQPLVEDETEEPDLAEILESTKGSPMSHIIPPSERPRQKDGRP
ncbi:MAG: hypothetical protein AAGI44_08535 [Pseudomonadota bacterium]